MEGKYITIDEKEERPNKKHECGIIWDEVLRELELKMILPPDIRRGKPKNSRISSQHMCQDKN